MLPIIEVNNLGKKYLLGERLPYLTLRDKFAGLFSSVRKRQSAADKEANVLWALKDVSFQVQQGEVLGIIGLNGSGKSTLLKILSRITPPTTGVAKLRGRVSSLLEVGTGFNPELTGRDNIFLNGAILGMKRHEIQKKFDQIVEFSGIEKFLDTPVKRYSSGMYVRLAFAVAAHLEPEILIVDEVLAVGDVGFQKKCLGKMDQVAKESGRTVLFVSHNMEAVQNLCGKSILLKNGCIEAFDTTQKVIDQYLTDAVQKKEEIQSNVREIKKDYFLKKAEIRDTQNNLRDVFEAGETIRIHIFANKQAPADNFTVEFFLYNEKGKRISFGAANPVQNTFYKKEQTEFVCELGPLPLTSGKYWFDFSVRVWGQERWDTWQQAAAFEIEKCDPHNTGFNNPAPVNGDFMINQEWH